MRQGRPAQADEKSLAHAELLRLLSYDSATGLFTRNVSMGRKAAAGTIAGWKRKDGYVMVRLGQGRRFLAHRLAWFYVHGVWPSHLIDHKNLCPSDNWIDNLRPATKGQNAQNARAKRTSYSGLKGVTRPPSHKRLTRPWRASIKVNGRHYCIGTFATAEEAHAAYVREATKYFGSYARIE